MVRDVVLPEGVWQRLRIRLHHMLRGRIERRHAHRMAADYARWIDAHDRLTPERLAALRQRVAALPRAQRLGLLVAAQGAAAVAVQATLASLQRQLHASWVARLLVDAADVPYWQAALAAEPRCAVVSVPAVTSAADAWRDAALALDADWCGPLRAGERLAPHALALIAEALAWRPKARAVYSDHDALDSHGERCRPAFKSDHNPELLLAVNDLLPLVLYSREALRTALIVDATPCDTLADVWHGLSLQALAGASADEVLHVPHVLAHTPHVACGSVRAVQRHLRRVNLSAVVQADAWGGCAVRFIPPDPAPLVSVIVPTRDRLELLQRCVSGVLFATDYEPLELLVIDNGSVEPATLAWLRDLAQDDRVRVLRDDRPFNYSALNNAAVAQARGELVLLLNNDTEVLEPSWLRTLVGVAVQADIGAVGARLWYAERTLQHAGLIVGLQGVAGDAHRRLPPRLAGYQGRAQRLQAFSAVTAACLLVRRASYLAVGGLDEQSLAVAYNDVDFCLKLRAAGLRNVWVPQAQLLHHESLSRGSDQRGAQRDRLQRETAVMQARWGSQLRQDPYYNPNLALQGRAFMLAWSPRVSLLHPWFEAQPVQGD